MPDIETYSNEFKIRIGETILKKHRLYLDTRYWIYMRDVLLGKATPVQVKIYEKLSDLVKKEIVICPLSPHVFIELMNIGDKEKRLNTAQVMDELSQQICFISPLDIVGQELLSFVRNCQAKAEGRPLFNPAKYVFTKVAFVMGDSYPPVDGIPVQQVNDIRVQFFDHLSEFTLVGMLNSMKNFPPLWDRKSLILRLNQGKDDNQDWKFFHEVFMHEIAGVIDVVKDDIEKLWIYLYENDAGGFITLEGIRNSESVRLLQNMIYNAFDQNKVNKELPFFHINASLHALIRYNKEQRYKKNDLIDFSHVAWALSYCNYFFTERRLCDWICSDLLKLDKIYGTKVLWKEEDVLNTLQTMW